MNRRDEKRNAARLESRLSMLRSELEALQTDMKGFAGDVEGAADQRVHLVLRKAEDLAQRAYRYAEDASVHVARDVEEWADDNIDNARNSIRAQPLSAIAVSIGAGALIGAIFGFTGRCSPRR